MTYFDAIWSFCVIAGFPLSLIGVVMVFFWFKEFEKSYPGIFNLPRPSASEFKRSTRYWEYILRGKYSSLDRPDVRRKCAILRAFFIIYLITFAIAFIGIVDLGKTQNSLRLP